MNAKRFNKMLKELGACSAALAFTKGKSLQEAWTDGLMVIVKGEPTDGRLSLSWAGWLIAKLSLMDSESNCYCTTCIHYPYVDDKEMAEIYLTYLPALEISMRMMEHE